MRENPEAIESLGTKVAGESLKLYAVGGAIAALSGGLLVEFIGAWSPAAWSTGETFIYFVAIIVGGLGNNFGALFGAFLVLGVFLEVPQYLPSLSYTNSEAAIQSSLIGVLILAFLWFRPKGAIPERRRKLASGRCHRRGNGAADPADVDAQRSRGSDRRSNDGSGTTTASGRPRPRRAVPAIVVRELERWLRRREGGGRRQLRRAGRPGHRPDRAQRCRQVDGAEADRRRAEAHERSDHRRRRRHRGLAAPRVARAGVIRTFQHTSEFARLTVLENLLVAAPGQPGDSLGGAHARTASRACRASDELLARAWLLLEQFHLTQHADTYAGELSGGQRRLVEIMRALMAEPEDPAAGRADGRRQPDAAADDRGAPAAAARRRADDADGRARARGDRARVRLGRGHGSGQAARHRLDGGAAEERGGGECVPRRMSPEPLT